MTEKSPPESGQIQPERQNPEQPKRKQGRLYFNMALFWPTLMNERYSDAARRLLGEAIDTALGRDKRACFVCSLPWAIDRIPVALLLVQRTGGEPGSMAMICSGCITWQWDDALLAAIHREFGLSPGELSVVHPEARV